MIFVPQRKLLKEDRTIDYTNFNLQLKFIIFSDFSQNIFT